MPAEAPRRRRSGGLGVELSRVSLERGGRRILRELDWSIEPGQRWVLLGANGAGKTQLLKLVAGDVWPTPTGRERLTWRFHRELFTTPMGVKEEVAYVGAERQDRYERYEWNLPVTRVVGSGLHREDWPLTPLRPADRAAIARVLRSLGLEDFAERRFLELSYGERRLVLLARALAARPALLLLDELLNGLDGTRRAEVLHWLEATAASRGAWVLATHRLADVPRSATHLLVLEGGRARHAGPLRRAMLERWFARAAGGARAPGLPRAARIPARSAAPHRPSCSARPLVTLENAQVWLDAVPVIDGLSFSVRPGECWVVHGGNGVGKSTLLRTLYGDQSVAIGGSLVRRGIEPGVPLDVFKRRVGLVAPHLQADHPLHLTVAEVVQTGRHASIGLNAPPTRADARAARAALARFGIGALAGAQLREISYGQFRRVLFARAWVNRPQLLLLDEPFEGLDPPTRRALHEGLEGLLGEGVAAVIATHHRSEWPRQASHEIELGRGVVRYAGPLRRAALAARRSPVPRTPAPRRRVPVRAGSRA